MSHVITSKLVVKDLDALEAACKELGAVLVRGQKTWKWWGRWVNDYHGNDAAYRNGVKPEDYGKCDHAINVPGVKYEVGVVKQPDGSFKLVYDFYGNGQRLKQLFGDGCGKLAQAYTKHKTLAELKRQGKCCIQQTVLANGTIKLTVNA